MPLTGLEVVCWSMSPWIAATLQSGQSAGQMLSVSRLSMCGAQPPASTPVECRHLEHSTQKTAPSAWRYQIGNPLLLPTHRAPAACRAAVSSSTFACSMGGTEVQSKWVDQNVRHFLAHASTSAEPKMDGPVATTCQPLQNYTSDSPGGRQHRHGVTIDAVLPNDTPIPAPLQPTFWLANTSTSPSSMKRCRRSSSHFCFMPTSCSTSTTCRRMEQWAVSGPYRVGSGR